MGILDAPGYSKAQTLAAIRAAAPSVARPAKPLIVFTFDDNPTTDKTVILPMLTARGIKASFCVTTSWVGNGVDMTWADLHMLEDAGHEIVCHSDTHANLFSANAATLAAEIDGAYAKLKAQGFNPVGYCWPFSTASAAGREAVRSKFQYALGGVGSTVQPLGTYAIARVGIGVGANLATLQARIDTAIAANELLIFLIHSKTDLDAAATTVLGQVMDYAKASAAAVVTAKEAFAQVGNLVDVGDYVGGTNYTVIGGSGKLLSSNVSTVGVVTALNAVQPSMLPNDFAVGKVTYSTVDASGNTSWPVTATASNIITIRTQSGSDQYVLQEFIAFNGASYTRRGTGSNTWGAWRVPSHRINIDDGAAMTKALTGFAVGTTLTPVTSPSTGGPGSYTGAGLLITHRIDQASYPGYSIQEFTTYGGTAVYRRSAATLTTWNAWQQYTLV